MSAISESTRRVAFGVWNKAFERYQISFREAGEPFRRQWVSSPEHLSDELTYAAQILWAINASLTEKSSPVFGQKIRQLIEGRTENEYQLVLSELEVAALLASHVSPIAFEPAVPVMADPASKPSSTDYSVSLPSGEIFIEATTFDLRTRAISAETLMKPLDYKLREKMRQAVRDRVFILAVKLLGPQEALPVFREIVRERVWPNGKFRRYGGILGLLQKPGELGCFQAVWLPNDDSITPPTVDVTDTVTGRRCYHLHRVKSLRCAPDEVTKFRRRVMAFRGERGIVVSVRLLGGPLDGIKTFLRPTQAGDTQILYDWDFNGTARNNATEIRLPPHGPIQVVYRRRTDTVYEFREFRFWMNELRPTTHRADYIPRLNF